MFIALIFIFTSVNLWGTTPPHALYLSVVEIDHTPSENISKIKIKVFQDDMQNALKNAYPNKNVSIGENVYPKYKHEVEQYFSEHFICQVNGESQKLILLDCQAEQNVYWISFETKCPKQWNRIYIKADFFMELFPTQSNVIRIKNGQKQKFMRLIKGTEEKSENFG